MVGMVGVRLRHVIGKVYSDSSCYSLGVVASSFDVEKRGTGGLRVSLDVRGQTPLWMCVRLMGSCDPATDMYLPLIPCMPQAFVR